MPPKDHNMITNVFSVKGNFLVKTLATDTYGGGYNRPFTTFVGPYSFPLNETPNFNKNSVMAGNKAINPKNSILPITTEAAIKAPIGKVPISPGKTWAGYLLKMRKAIKEADNENNNNWGSWLFSTMQHTPKEKEAIAPNPASSPLKPARMFVAFEQADTANKTRM